MELLDLFLLVRWDPTSPEDCTVIDEATFVKYMTTDTDMFFPQVRANRTSINGKLFDGYLWFNENLDILAVEQSANVASWLADIVGHFSSFDFRRHRELDDPEEVYAFMPASMLSPSLLDNVKLNGYAEQYPFAVARKAVTDFLAANTTPTVHAEANALVKTERPLWLL